MRTAPSSMPRSCTPAPSFLQLRFEALDRFSNSGFQAIGMKSVQDKQAADHGIAAQLFDDLHPRSARIGQDFQHPIQARPVKLHDQLHKLGGRRPHRGVGDRFDLLHQSANSLNPLLEILFV